MGRWRFLTLELGAGNPADVDSDGVVEAIEEPPGRIQADDAFAKDTTTTSVRIIMDTVTADGTTTGLVWGELRYQNEADIVVNADGSRTIFLGQMGAAAATAGTCART